MKDTLFSGLKYAILSLLTASVLFILLRFRTIAASFGSFNAAPDHLIYNTFLFALPAVFFSFLLLAFLLVQEYQYHVFDSRKEFFSALDSELRLAQENDSKLSLLLFSIEPDIYRKRETVLEQIVMKYVPESSSFFSVNTLYAVIVPSFSAAEIEQKASALYEEMKNELDAGYASFFAGITSRQKRRISPRLLYHEAKITLELAKEEDIFCIMSFQIDSERYKALFG